MKHMPVSHRLIIAAVPLYVVFTQASAAENRAEPMSGKELNVENGMRIYRSVCAECHDGGKNGAPQLQEEGWAKRSFEWFSVMNKHASQGFLAMPAKGNRATLTDEELRDAVFYMMEETNSRK